MLDAPTLNNFAISAGEILAYAGDKIVPSS